MPPGVNALYRTWRGRILLSVRGREYKAAAVRAAKRQGAKPMHGELAVTLRIYRPRKAGDIDGYLKGCFDSLNGLAWEDDKQVVELHVHRGDDKANPRIEVTVEAADVVMRDVREAAREIGRGFAQVSRQPARDWKALASPASYPRRNK